MTRLWFDYFSLYKVNWKLDIRVLTKTRVLVYDIPKRIKGVFIFLQITIGLHCSIPWTDTAFSDVNSFPSNKRRGTMNLKVIKGSRGTKLAESTSSSSRWFN